MTCLVRSNGIGSGTRHGETCSPGSTWCTPWKTAEYGTSGGIEGCHQRPDPAQKEVKERRESMKWATMRLGPTRKGAVIVFTRPAPLLFLLTRKYNPSPPPLIRGGKNLAKSP